MATAKGSIIGVDVGSTTAKVVAVSATGDLLFHQCLRHRGRPKALASELLEAARLRFPGAPLGVTGSVGVALAGELSAVPVHEVHAVGLAVRQRHPEALSVVELGGQDAKILRLDGSAHVDAEMNDRCAAGTGATIDRIASRLGLDEGQLAGARLVGDLSVAAKCGVFAETDIVNLLKRGASWQEALSALARAIVVQNLAVLSRGRVLRPPIVLLGGPHAHLPILAEAWRQCLAELWSDRGLDSGPVLTPDHAELYAALGAAHHVRLGGRPLARVEGVLGSERAAPALWSTLDDGKALAALTCAATPPVTAGVVRVHLGVDAGSTTSKVVAIDEGGHLVASAYGPSLGNPIDDARERLKQLERDASAQGARFEVLSLGVTGYGAELLAPAFGADLSLVETVAHARAALEEMPDADVVVDVGGTDVKIMCLEGERVAHFHLSNQCSAGHGAFLATAAEDLGVALDDYADRALGATRMPRFTVGCGVFMDTDRVTFQRRGFTTSELLAGLAWALPRNIWEYVVAASPRSLGRRFLLTGGTQQNLAAAWAQAKYLHQEVPGATVRVHPHPGLCGALGVALTNRAERDESASSSFVGFERLDAVRAKVTTGQDTRCQRCEVGCARTVVEFTGVELTGVELTGVEPEGVELESEREPRRLLIGNACERGADLESTQRRTGAHATDAVMFEVGRLFRAPPPGATAMKDAPRIGIPRVMGLYRSAPLLMHYLCAAGLPYENIVLSPPTSTPLFQDGARWGVTDPCFPSKLVLSHVDWLLHQPIDVLLMPTLTHAKIAVRGTRDTASCPIVTASGHVALAALGREGDPLGERGIQALVPELCVTDPALLERQLRAVFGELLSLDEAQNREAFEAGLAAQRAFHADCRRLGAKVLARARREGKAVAVILARPYHADPGVQHGISTELAARGLPVLGISSLPLEDESLLDLHDVLPEATNSGCAEKTWAARVIAQDPNLVAVDLSSFRCGQDASIMGTLGDLLDPLDKPTLRLHDLDEDRPGATFRIRLETFLHAVRRYEARIPKRLPPARPQVSV